MSVAKSHPQQLRSRLTEHLGSVSNRRLWLYVFAPLWAVYLATATWSLPYHADAHTNVVTAWYLGMTGSPVLTQHEQATGPDYFGNIDWFVESPRGPVAQYPPGAALLAAPLYRIASQPMEPGQIWGNNRPDVPRVDFPLPSFVPAAITATGVTAAAMAFLALTFRTLSTTTSAFAGAYLAGLGTGAWSVAADMLWQHGPAMLWIAIGLWCAARDRLFFSGLALGAAVLTRPHTAVIAASMGLFASLRLRSWRPIWRIGFGSGLGLIGLIAYNYAIWGRLTVSGGYGQAFTDRFLDGQTHWFLSNVWAALFDERHGLLIWAPFLIVLAVGLRAAAKRAPAWALGAAIGGALYLLVQLKANRFSGGDGHWAYRYPLEALAAAAPLLLVAYTRGVRGKRLRVRLMAITSTVAIALQAVGAIVGR